jgi:hypothetical protein
MRTKVLSALMACGVLVAVSGYAADPKDKQAGLTGKWATDAVATAQERKTQGGVLDSIIKSGSQVGANAVPSGRNNGFGGNSGFGGNNNRNGGFGGREFAAPQFGQPQSGFGQQQQGTFGGNNQQMRNGGMVTSRSGLAVDIDGPTVLQEGRSDDGVALTMELKVDKNKITGSVTEVVTKTKTTIEPGKVDGNKFEFTVWVKKGDVKLGTVYTGELTDPMTIELKRTMVGGNPVKGDPDVLVFHRAQ